MQNKAIEVIPEELVFSNTLINTNYSRKVTIKNNTNISIEIVVSF